MHVKNSRGSTSTENLKVERHTQYQQILENNVQSVTKLK